MLDPPQASDAGKFVDIWRRLHHLPKSISRIFPIGSIAERKGSAGGWTCVGVALYFATVTSYLIILSSRGERKNCGPREHVRDPERDLWRLGPLSCRYRDCW